MLHTFRKFLQRFAFGLCAMFILTTCVSAADTTTAAPVTGQAGITESTDLYWVTFSGDCSCDSIFMMQIDSAGNVIREPKAVLDIATYGAGASAIGKKSSSKLYLWHWKSSTFLMRAVINKDTLVASKKKTLPVYSVENEFLQVSQNPSKNFFIAEDTDAVLTGYYLNSKGKPTGEKFVIAPDAPMSSDEASISSDGLAIVTNRNDDSTTSKDELYVQLLDADGKSIGAPTFLAKFDDIEAADITNALDQGARFVAYIVDYGTTPDDKLYLQKIDANGQKLGKAKVVNVPPDRDEDSQVVAIDPLGRFVLFTMDGADYGCANQDILMYQALSDKGKKQGAPKVVASCSLVSDDIMNLDILKE